MTPTPTKPIPLILTPHEARGLHENRITQLRRVVKPQPKNDRVGMVNAGYCGHPELWFVEGAVSEYTCKGETPPQWKSPFGSPGDVLLYKEAFRVHGGADARIEYCAGGVFGCGSWEEKARAFIAERLTPSQVAAAMEGVEVPPPKQAANRLPDFAVRAKLEVLAVRVEQVQAITGEDIAACGVANTLFKGEGIKWFSPKRGWVMSSRDAFADRWDTLHGPGAWDRNEFCFVADVRPVRTGGAA